MRSNESSAERAAARYVQAGGSGPVLQQGAVPVGPHARRGSVRGDRLSGPAVRLVDRHGRILRPTLPATKCGRPFQAAITDLEHLPWVTVSVRRTVQIATRAELLAGCDPKYGDVIAAGSYFLQLRLSAGGPAFLPRPPRLRICIYQRGSETFIRGGIISQKGESELLADIQGGRSSTSCRWRHTSYAVLLAVSPAYRGGEIAEAEIGGCNRILRPDSQVGTISPAGLKVISRAFRSRQT